MPSIKINGGRFNRRVLSYQPFDHLRPSRNAVRETAFNILHHRFNMHAPDDVLDAFAGLGSYGFQALSHGAKYVTFMDSHPLCLDQIRQFATALSVESEVCIEEKNLPQDLCTHHKRYDLIFLDPPYAQFDLDYLIKKILFFLKPGGILMLESPHIPLSPIFYRKSGPCFLSFYGS